jgi:hypothetical protein
VNPASLASFADELGKIAASAGLAHIPKVRTGRRPISVDALLEKDKDGEWLRKKADSMGSPQDVRGDSVDDPGAVPLPKRRGEVPTKDPGNIPQSEKSGSTPLARRLERMRARLGPAEKTGTVPGANTQTPAFTSGEDARAGNSKARLPGEVPTQDNMSVGEPNNRIELRMGRLRPVITNDESAKRTRKGDVPTQNRDMNIIDRFDGRDSATTVTGLGQHSTNIGAMQNTVEHT